MKRRVKPKLFLNILTVSLLETTRKGLTGEPKLSVDCACVPVTMMREFQRPVIVTH
jgi:hypothetical protein